MACHPDHAACLTAMPTANRSVASFDQSSKELLANVTARCHALAKANEFAYITIKLNSALDEDQIDTLYDSIKTILGRISRVTFTASELWIKYPPGVVHEKAANELAADIRTAFGAVHPSLYEALTLGGATREDKFYEDQHGNTVAEISTQSGSGEPDAGLGPRGLIRQTSVSSLVIEVGLTQSYVMLLRKAVRFWLAPDMRGRVRLCPASWTMLIRYRFARLSWSSSATKTFSLTATASWIRSAVHTLRSLEVEVVGAGKHGGPPRWSDRADSELTAQSQGRLLACSLLAR
jgi:hypothetical protein